MYYTLQRGPSRRTDNELSRGYVITVEPREPRDHPRKQHSTSVAAPASNFSPFGKLHVMSTRCEVDLVDEEFLFSYEARIPFGVNIC